jgi:hypothetical protein
MALFLDFSTHHSTIPVFQYSIPHRRCVKFRNWNPSKESNAYEIDKNQSFFTLAHEIGHHVHENLLPDGLKTQIWAAAQKDGFVVLGNYDPDKEPPPSVYEYFANSYAYWLNPEDKDQLYINHNEVYNILEGIFRRTQ